MSHSCTVPSPLPAARVSPSGLNTTELTAPAGPLSRAAEVGEVRQLHGVGRPHNQTPSALPAARVAPSGLNATELTGAVGPVGSHVPQPGGAIGVAGGQRSAAGAERDRVNWAGGAGEGGDLPVAGHVPQPGSAIGV